MLMKFLFKSAYICLELHQKALSEQALSKMEDLVMKTGPCMNLLAVTYRCELYGICAGMQHTKYIGCSGQQTDRRIQTGISLTKCMLACSSCKTPTFLVNKQVAEC